MGYLKNNQDSIVYENEDTGVGVTKEILSERGNFGKTFTSNELLERETSCLQLLEQCDFSPNLISIDSSNTFTMESFSHMEQSFDVPEKFEEIIKQVRDSFKKMEESGFLKIGIHHSEVFWDQKLEEVKIVDYGAVHFLEEGKTLTMLTKTFNEIKLRILYFRMLKRSLVKSYISQKVGRSINEFNVTDTSELKL